MGTTQVLKPIHGTAVQGGNFGTTLGGDDDYTIKVTDIAVQARSNFQDVTGDGDTDVAYEHNSLMYYTVQQRGFMVGGTGDKSIGILNIVDERNSGLPPKTITIKQASGYDIFVNARCWVTSVDVQWNYSASQIGVAMSLVISDAGTASATTIVDVST